MKKMSIILIFMITIFFLNACTTLINQNEVSYGDHERQVMDIMMPDQLSDGEVRPVVLFIHGGGWVGGDKKSYLTSAKDINGYGYIYASMNYHYVDEDTHYLTLINDIKLAIDYLFNHNEQYHIDTDGIALVGVSAGAHLAMLYAYRLNNAQIPVSFVVSRVGPTDFTDEAYFGEDMISPGDEIALLLGKTYNEITYQTMKSDVNVIDASPISHVNENSVPTIMAYGKLDVLVPYSNATRLDDKLTEFGVSHAFITYENSDHGLRSSLDQETENLYFNTLIEYLDTYLIIKDYEN